MSELKALKQQQVALTRETLQKGVLDQVDRLLDVIGDLDAVGESAEQCVRTLTHFRGQAQAFLARTAPKPALVADDGVSGEGA